MLRSWVEERVSIPPYSIYTPLETLRSHINYTSRSACAWQCVCHSQRNRYCNNQDREPWLVLLQCTIILNVCDDRNAVFTNQLHVAFALCTQNVYIIHKEISRCREDREQWLVLVRYTILNVCDGGNAAFTNQLYVAFALCVESAWILTRRNTESPYRMNRLRVWVLFLAL